jgi:SAM-dependent methyltransferase
MLLSALGGSMDRTYGTLKERLLGGHPSRLVEIGPGPGGNLRYYRPGSQVVAFEPNPAMHARLQGEAAHRGLVLDLHPRGGEDLDLPDGSVELVVATLVLCTVADPDTVLAEIRRVLAPGGRLVFLEHVVAPPGTALRRLQKVLHRPWRWLFEGCHLQRDTAAAIRRAGFARLELEEFRVPPPFFPGSPHVAGIAVR